jgi:hypothetical protein
VGFLGYPLKIRTALHSITGGQSNAKGKIVVESEPSEDLKFHG